MSVTVSKLGMAILPSWLGPGDLTIKFKVWLVGQSFVFISTFFCVASENEELPWRSCPSPTQSDALSPRWQHIYIVAMDTTSITLCMAFTDLQIKYASLTVMSEEPGRGFGHTQWKHHDRRCHTWLREQRWPTQRSMVYQLFGQWLRTMRCV